MGLLDKLSAWLGRGARPATVLVLGLDNSGKSTTLAALAANAPTERPRPAVPSVPAVPTVGQQNEHFTYLPCRLAAVPVLELVVENAVDGGVSFSAWDVSGAARLRALWERHYRRADAVIFVVDAADHLRLVVAREELELMLGHPDMCGRRVPLLVLANKSDLPHALSAVQLAAALCLERVCDKPWHVCATSATSGAGLPDGVAWLARQLRDARLHGPPH